MWRRPGIVLPGGEGFGEGEPTPESWNEPFNDPDLASAMSMFDLTTPAELAEFLDTAEPALIETLNLIITDILEGDDS